jgi:hypothetical protein
MSGGPHCFRVADMRTGWRRIGFLMSLTIITVSGIVLYPMLRGISLEDVIDSIEAVEPHNVVKAAVFVAASYL